MRLTPFAERLPYADYFSFAIDALKWGVGISSWGIGKEQKLLTCHDSTGKSFTIGTIICIESIYPDFVRSYTTPNVENNSSANVLVVITNDAWYDFTPGPRQHYFISQMRAIENRRVVVRSANTGVSGFISPLGQSISELPQYTKSAGSETIPLMGQSTVFIMLGDWVPQLSLLVCLFFTIWFTLRKRNSLPSA
jgi:apolipoprotein N-acyltransferase